MQPGEVVQFTDGKGYKATTVITTVQKKKLAVEIKELSFAEPAGTRLHLCIAFTKNTGRNEWLLEKITEMGISSITPLITTRTEREKIRYDRWQNILVSALLQSQQYYLPELKEALSFATAVEAHKYIAQKLVAHCMAEKKRTTIHAAMQAHKETIIFIGPEGDFTAEEVDLCEAQGFTGISLSNNRLRTETAAMAACAYFNLLNHV